MITKDEAIKIAKELAAAAGWTWVDPVSVMLTTGARKKWEILTNNQSRGVNVRVVIDAETGEVLTKGYNPR
jgi:hypothetical protein